MKVAMLLENLATWKAIAYVKPLVRTLPGRLLSVASIITARAFLISGNQPLHQYLPQRQQLRALRRQEMASGFGWSVRNKT
jgi:hypothetical protein